MIVLEHEPISYSIVNIWGKIIRIHEFTGTGTDTNTDTDTENLKQSLRC